MKATVLMQGCKGRKNSICRVTRKGWKTGCDIQKLLSWQTLGNQMECRYYENLKIIESVIDNDIWSKWLDMCKHSKLKNMFEESYLSSPE